MNWWKNELERLSKTEKGQKILSDNANLINKIDELLDKTVTESLQNANKEALVDDVTKLMKAIQLVKPEEVQLEDDTKVNIYNVFERVIRTLNTRVNKKWEEEVLKYLNSTREKLGISQVELANRTGYSHSYINRISSLKRGNISLDVFKNMCDGLGLDMAEVLREVGDLDDFNEINDKEPMTLEDVLLRSTFTINESSVSAKQKMAIAKLVSDIMKIDWEENMENISKLVNIVNEFKK